jgi:hypothetical protein
MSKLHVYVALRRVSASKNENAGLTKLCKRFVDKDGDEQEMLRRVRKACDEPGLWRIYRSVNKRDTEKALKLLQVKIIMTPEQVVDKVDSEWKSILMGSKCKGERKFLIDVDNPDVEHYKKVLNFLHFTEVMRKDESKPYKDQLRVYEQVSTPNGFHVVTEAFDTRELEKQFPDVEVKRDDLLYVESFEV